jgi:prepilin-type N-terminal cleavage/methylation domain-containing protein
MKSIRSSRRGQSAFTLIEVLISMSVVSMVMGMCMSTFLFGLRTMYKDSKRLETNASLRSLMAQISKETLDASYFYVFPYYTRINTNTSLVPDTPTGSGPSSMAQIENAADDDYDKWVAHGDCLVLVTTTSAFRTTDIRQIRIYYRTVTTQAQRNTHLNAAMRFYETPDWTEGTAGASNTHPLSNLAAELNAINLNANPNRSGSKQLVPQTIGRVVPSPYTPFAANDRYPVFSSESPDSTSTNGFIAINMEVVTGNNINNMLSSSSFNYTVSPRR